MKKRLKSFVLVTLLAPSLALAQGAGTIELVWIPRIQYIVRTLTVIVAGVALLVFFWGLVKYIASGADDAKVAGKRLMIWGTIALFVMVSIWGIVALISGELGIQSGWQPNFNEIVPNN